MKPPTSHIRFSFACIAIAAALQSACDARNVSDSLAASAKAAGAAAVSTATAVDPIYTPAVVDRSAIDYSQMPLWAWGVAEPPKHGDSQAVNGAPSDIRPNRFANLPPEELHRKRRAKGSRLEMSFAEFRNIDLPGVGAKVVDWFPEDHPNPMPDVIRFGPAALGTGRTYLQTNRACGSCHLADGSGRPENGSPAALSSGYILRQLRDFRDGLRHDVDPRKANSNTMVMLSKAMTDAEMRESAEYFSAVRWRPHVRVVETTHVPKTKLQGELFVPTGEPGHEPISNRIVEISEDLEQTQELSSSRGTWIAYVPVGAVAKGEALVRKEGVKVESGWIVQGKSTACTTCHGEGLQGVSPDIPPLAGRSPSYLARQIFNIQQGVRAGSIPDLKLMRVAFRKLTADDILNITAYLASLPVPAPRGE